MSGGLPPPRTSWPGSGPLRPSRLPAGEPSRTARPSQAGADDGAGTDVVGPQPPTPRGRQTRLERVYVITGGRSAPPADLGLVTLIVAADSPPRDLSPEQAAIMRLCRRPLSVAELSAHLRLPFSATAILVADLLAAGLAAQRRPVRPAHVDPELLKQVINGLRRL